MATTAGLPLLSQNLEVHHCYVISELNIEEEVKLKSLTVPQMKLLLNKWSIRYIAIDSIIKTKFFGAVETLFALNGMPEVTQELMESAEIGNIIDIDVPDWVRNCRVNNISESEIREVVKTVGITPEIMCKANEQVMKKLGVGSPAKRVIENLLEKWKLEYYRENGDSGEAEISVKTRVKPDANVRRALFSDGHLDGCFEDSNEHRNEISNKEQNSENCINPEYNERSYRKSTVGINSNEAIPVSEKQKINMSLSQNGSEEVERAKVKLPILPDFVGSQRGGDPWGWLELIKRILEISRCHRDDKLMVLKKAMAYEFLPFAKIEDKKHHNWESYIQALEIHLRNPQTMSQALSEFQEWKWNWDLHPEEFVKKLEQLITKVKGEPTSTDMIFHILSRIPKEMYDTLVRLEKLSDVRALTACMVTEYNIHIRDNKEKPKVEKQVSTKSNKDEKKVEKQGISNPSNQTGRQPYKCFNCNRIGHTSRDCRLKRRSDFSQNKDKEKHIPANLRLQKPPTYGQGSSQNQSSSSNSNQEVKPIEGANLMSEMSAANQQLARAPQSDYLFMMNDVEDEKPVELITQIDTGMRNFPTVRLTVCYPNREFIRIGDVLIDTGACSSCIDYELAQQFKAFNIKSNVTVKGIIADTVQNVEGASYAILKHPKMSVSRVIKFQVMRNLEPKMVLGNRFSDLFFIGMVNHGGRYQVNVKEKVEGEWLSPELLFRFCTPEESLGLIGKPEVPVIATVGEKENFFNSLETTPVTSVKESTKRLNELDKDDKENIMESFNFLTELSKCEEVMDNIVPVYLEVESKELNLAERLVKRMDKNLSSIQRQELLQVLLEFREVFAQSKKDLGLVPWQKWPIKIDIGDNTIPYQRPYPCTKEKRLEYRKITDELLANDIIEKSDADGGSPALLVGKPDGSFRLLNDLRAVNRLTKVVFHPMPRVDDCLEAIRGAKYFNMFDLFQGYFQIEIPPDERWKTVFVTPDAKFQYKRLPMGLACAPFEFQRLMNTVLHGLSYTECLGYFDDIPVIGKDWEELLKNTSLVLDRLRDWNLKIKTDKCHFGTTELVLLGHLVNGEGIRPDPDKVLALKRMPYPISVKQLQSQLGCYNYFARYISSFSKLAAPLYRLVSKERKFKMIRQDHEALDRLKNSLIETTLLVHFDPELRKKITVDASDVAVGGILMQEDPKQTIHEGFKSLKDVPLEKVKHWKPMYFFSQKLAKHQQSYSVSEKECLAVLVAIKKFKHYLDGDEFIVETDHHALCQLPKLKFKNQRLERWTIILSSFRFKVVYTKGDKHGPDCLSRYQNEWEHRKLIDPEAEYIENLFFIQFSEFGEIENINESEIHCVKNGDSSLKKTYSTIYHYQTDENWKLNLIDEQKNDEVISEIIFKLVSDPQSELHKNFLYLNNLLFRKPTIGYDTNRIVINEGVLKKIFEEEHSSSLGGHFGVEKTYLQIARKFWINRLYDKVKELVNNCQTCYIGKSNNVTYAEPALKPIPDLVLDRLEMDAQGPIVFKGGVKRIILVLIDSLSRFVYAKLFPNQKSKTVKKFLKEYFSILGYPSTIQTDRGRNFLSDEVSRYLKNIGVKHEISNAYHPQSQGIVERVNRTIAERLRTSIIDKEVTDLEDNLEDAVLAINGSIHKVHRFTPYYLVFGRHLKKPIDLQLDISVSINTQVELCRAIAKERLLKRQLYYQEKLKLVTKRNPFQIGDLCFTKNSAPSIGTTKKLVEKFFGPFLVIGVKRGSVLLLDPKSEERFTSNLELTKPHKGNIPEYLKTIREKIISENRSTANDNENDLCGNEMNETISNEQLVDSSLNDIDEFEDFNPDQNELAKSNEDNVNETANQTEHDNDDNAKSDASTVIEENCTNLRLLNSKKKRKKRKKYISANRDIMKTKVISAANEFQGPVTRNRKLISVNMISFVKLKKLKDDYFELESFEYEEANYDFENNVEFENSANQQLAIFRAFAVKDKEREKNNCSLPICPLYGLVDFDFLRCFNPFTNLNQSELILFNYFTLICEVEFNLIKYHHIIKSSFSCEHKTKVNVKTLFSLVSTLSLKKLSVTNFDIHFTLTNIEFVLINYIYRLSSPNWEKFVINGEIEKVSDIVIMSSSVHSDYDNDENASIVSSTTFGEELARQLADIQQNLPTQRDFPLVDLEKDETSNDPQSSNSAQGNNVTNISGGAKRIIFETIEEDAMFLKLSDQTSKYEQLKLNDPLPHYTASGSYAEWVQPFMQTKDVSPYPPPTEDQGRINCYFPAPRPPTEQERPPWLRLDFFEKAKEDINGEMEKVNADKALFETFIREKIQINAFTLNLDNVKFSSLRKGLHSGKVIHPDFQRLKELITCQLCEQIAIVPRSCEKCIKTYCLGCARWLQRLPKDIGTKPVEDLNRFCCINGNCLIDIEDQGYSQIVPVSSLEIRNFYEGATFKCQRIYCDKLLSFGQMTAHYQSCKQGPIDWTIDQTLLLPFLEGPVRAEINSKPKSISSLLPHHLKIQNPNKTIPQYWRKRALCYAFLLKCYEENPTSITPLQLRTQANFGIGYWNNEARKRDPYASIDESEKFALDIGFPSCSLIPIQTVPDSERKWPQTWHPSIPWWLLKESSNWQKWSRYYEIDGSSISNTSSKVLYALDIEDPESPFVRINPFERLTEDEASTTQELLNEKFPSCFNSNNVYETPKPSQNQATIQAIKKKRNRLAEAFKNRPQVNLPPMLQEQLDEIEEQARSCPDRHLTFSINSFVVNIAEKDDNGEIKKMPRPCWFVILDGNFEICYETFVRHKQIEKLNHQVHGLNPKDLRYARNLNTVRDQVIKFLVCAKRVIGHGLINQLRWLGLTKQEIRLLNPKFRDIDNFYSPYVQNPMNIHAITYLWFSGYTLPAETHSPVVEAITTMRLFLLQWREIEQLAETNHGIHNENVSSTCGNEITSALLLEFEEGLRRGLVQWPDNWKFNKSIAKFPSFSANCVAPSEKIHKKSIDYMAKPKLDKLESTKAQELFKPESRMKRLVQMIKARKNTEGSDDQSH